jgi:hypothetical protein
MDAVRQFVTCCCEMYVNIIVQTTFSLPGVGFLSWFATRTYMSFSSPPCLPYTSALSCLIIFDEEHKLRSLSLGNVFTLSCRVFDLSSHIFLDTSGPETKFHAHVKNELKFCSFVYFNLIPWVLNIRRTDRIFWPDWSQAFHKCNQLLNFVILFHYYL